MSDELNTHPRTILNVAMYTIQNFWLFGVKLWILGGRIHNAILAGWKKKKKKSKQPVSSADNQEIGWLNSLKAAFNFLSSYL